MRPLAILRPEPGASATAEAARALGLQPKVIPLFRVEPLAWAAPDPARFDGLLITSGNAIRFGGSELHKLQALPTHAVGEMTAAAARDADFQLGSVGSGGVDALLASLPTDLRLLHLCGADRREPQNPSQTIASIPVYRSRKLAVPENFADVERTIVAVHSPLAGARLAELADKTRLDRKHTSIAAISAQAAAAAGRGWEAVEIADQPSDRALLVLAVRLCQNAAR